MTINKLVVLGSLLFLAAPLVAAPDNELAAGILGMHLNMTREQAQTRLKEIGTFERAERKQQEIWKVRDESYSHLIIGVGKDEKLRFITAVAREDNEAKRVPYSEVGNLETAKQAGDVAIKNFNYEWNLPPRHDQPETRVNARGRDPKYLTTYSIKRLEADGE